jgi:hypothetical protein
VDKHVHRDWSAFRDDVLYGEELRGRGFFFSKSVGAGKHGDVRVDRAEFFPEPDGRGAKVALIFGSEHRGLG